VAAFQSCVTFRHDPSRPVDHLQLDIFIFHTVITPRNIYDDSLLQCQTTSSVHIGFAETSGRCLEKTNLELRGDEIAWLLISDATTPFQPPSEIRRSMRRESWKVSQRETKVN